MIAVLGSGELARALASALAQKGERPLCLVTRRDEAEALGKAGFRPRLSPEAAIADLVPSGAGAAFVLMESDGANLRAVQRLRRRLPDLLILTRSPSKSTARRLRAAGANYILDPGALLAHAFLGQITELEEQRTADRLVEAVRACGKRGLAVFLHDNPDPDAIASAAALRRICTRERVPVSLFHGGDISHPGNRLMASALRLPLERVGSPEEAARAARSRGRTALVESNLPGQNNALPRGARVDIVIDHHPLPPRTTVRAAFADIRPRIGAASTLLTGYLRHLWLRPDPTLASALLHAIKVDTSELTRNVSAEDLAAAVYLSELAELKLMQRFVSPPMPGATAEVISRAVGDRECVRGHLLAFAGTVPDRDSLALAADFLVRLDGVDAAVVWGLLGEDIYISARSADPSLDVGSLLRRAFSALGSAGGHAGSAGARIPLAAFSPRGSPEGTARFAVRRTYLRAAGLFGG